MWSAIRTLRLFVKSLTRIASAIEEIRDLYKLELASRGITPLSPAVHDEVEVVYGYREPVEE
jgi:hypothetical protein